MTITVRGDAKINLTLEVTSKRTDGYHELRSVMQSVDLYELVTLEENDSGRITVSCDKPDIPCDDSNIAVKCAKAFFESSGVTMKGLSISIEKNIPAQAGLAGGSADGAAVLRGLNELYGKPLSEEKLLQTGAKVGADIPFCLTGGTALAEGIGEKLTKLPDLPDCGIVLVKPDIGISTGEAYGAVDKAGMSSGEKTNRMIPVLGDIGSVGANLCNDFENALNNEELKALKAELRSFDGCLGACMSGSGSTVFAVFADMSEAESCAQTMQHKYPFAKAVSPTRSGTTVIQN